MEEVLKMDIFFVITSVVVIVLGVFVAVILYRVIRILNNVEKISKEVADGAALLKGDFNRLRGKARKLLQKLFMMFKVK